MAIVYSRPLTHVVTGLFNDGIPSLQLNVYGQDKVNALMQYYPKEWFCFLKQTDRIGVFSPAKKPGKMYLTRKGYEANKEAIIKLFLAANTGISRSGFEKEMEIHFKKIEMEIKERIKNLYNEITWLEQFDS